MERCGTAGQTTDDNIIRDMRIAYWLTKVKNTDSEYVIHNAFALQQKLRERASILLYMYSICSVLLPVTL